MEKKKETKATDYNSTLQFLELSQIELPNYTEVYQSYNEWIKYGENNNFPIFLQHLANNSALHNAIISSKVENICGKGFTYDKKKDNKTDLFIESANPNETLAEVFFKLTYDYILYGGYAANVIKNRNGQIAEIYAIDFAKIRSGKKNEKGIVNDYFFSNDWSNYRKSQNTPLVIPAYQANSNDPSSLIYIKEYRPGMEYYPVPAYVGALTYINADVEIANFHLSHIKNGMTPSIMITLTNGIPTEEEQKTIKRKFENNYAGTDNAGKFMINFSDDPEKTPKVDTLTPSQLDKQFIQLQDTVLQNILSGHKVVSPMLVGIKTDGQLGGASELENAYTIYNNSVIEPAREYVLKTINKIAKINGLQELKIINNNPIEFMWSENVLQTIMTTNEMRDKVGMEPLMPEDITSHTEPIIVNTPA